MKYFEVNFLCQGPKESLATVSDVVAALAGEAGFESFEYTEEGLKGYVQQDTFSKNLLDELLSSLPFEGVRVSYEVKPAEDKDWNEAWEQEGFEPIVVGDSCLIHDGRHKKEGSFEVEVEIDARLAFGTGNHETTRMMVGALLEMPMEGKRVLDCGCGTGILGIVAMKCGAARCTAYDIDEWSADNSRHNAVINHVDNYEVRLGDASVLTTIQPHQFDIVMANINRNILLSDMPQFQRMLAPGGTLLLSGFYREDIPLLAEKAQQLGLSLIDKQEDNNWALIELKIKN